MNPYSKKGKLRFSFQFVWALPLICCSAAVTLINQINYYATNVLGLSPALVGTILLVSKIFDGFTDIVAGFLIDKTNTKWGRGRPYDLAYFFYYLFAILMFAVPVMSVNATAAYLFVMYSMVFSVFQTLFSTSGTVYMARAITDENDRVKLTSTQGLLVYFFAVVVSLFIPQMIENAGTDRAAWTKMAVVLMVPFMALSVLRMFLIKEKPVDSASVAVKFSLKEGASMLFKNKYSLISGVVLLLANIGGNVGTSVNTYYFQYVFGDIGKMSIIGLTALATPIALFFFPALIKKFGLTRIIQVGLGGVVLARLIPLIDTSSLLLVFVSNLLVNLASAPLSLFAGLLIMDCMDYGEWISGKRGEGIYAIVSGFASKVGLGISSGLAGLMMSIGGFDSAAAVQSEQSINTIISLTTILPAVIMAGALIFMLFYDLEKKLPAIKKDLEVRHQAESAN